MARGCVFNECCLDDISGEHEHIAIPMLHQLGQLVRAVGPLRVTGTVLNKTVGLGDPLSEWLRRVLQRGGQEREEARSLASALVSLSSPAKLDWDCEAKLSSDNTTSVIGLAVAHLNGELAVSLNTSDRWDFPFIGVTLDHLDDCASNFRTENVQVRHAIRDMHLETHRVWLDGFEDAMGQLRLRLYAQRSSIIHKKATEYKKHVKGSTNLERRRIASTRLEGQFLQESAGNPIGDEHITQWERSVLDRVMAGDGTVTVIHHGPNTYHIYADMGHPIGYLGEADASLTNCIRVEWSSNAVHSHPRKKDLH